MAASFAWLSVLVHRQLSVVVNRKIVQCAWWHTFAEVLEKLDPQLASVDVTGNYLYLYCSLAKKGPWMLYLTLSPDKGVSGYLWHCCIKVLHSTSLFWQFFCTQIIYTRGVSAWPYAKWVGLVGVGLCAAKVMAGTHFSTKLCTTWVTENHRSTFKRWDTTNSCRLFPQEYFPDL